MPEAGSSGVVIWAIKVDAINTLIDDLVRPTSDVARTIGRIVVGQLLTLPDVACGNDPDRFALDDRVAVRAAVVIDVAGDVATDGGITHIQAIQLEAPDMPLFQVAILAVQADTVLDLLTVVGDDPLVLVDRLQGKDAPAFDFGFATFDLWQRNHE